MVLQGDKFGLQITMLAERGYRGLAQSVVDQAGARGWITAAAQAALTRDISGKPDVPLPAGHEVLGMFEDSIVSTLHFTPQTDRDLAREAFRQAVRWIEIETSSQCNRRCSYCPNSRFDRMTGNDFFNERVFERVVGDLTEIRYDGDIKFVGNNEFFMHRENRRYIEYTHARLPAAKLTLFSNGDYMTRDDLEWASANGVQGIIVTLHPGPTKHYSDAEVLRRAWLFQKQLGTPLQLLHFDSGKSLYFRTSRGNTGVVAGLSDLEAEGHNWTGLLPGDEGFVRTDPCSYPLRQFVVNYAGDIFMCCIAFKDRTSENAAMGAITGNLAGYDSIFQAYTSPGLTAWRRSLMHNQEKEAPCRTCRGHRDYREAKARPLADLVAQRLAWEAVPA